MRTGSKKHKKLALWRGQERKCKPCGKPIELADACLYNRRNRLNPNRLLGHGRRFMVVCRSCADAMSRGEQAAIAVEVRRNLARHTDHVFEAMGGENP